MSPGDLERLREQPARPVALPKAGTSGKIVSGLVEVTGWSIRDLGAGGGSVFELYDGDDVKGGLVASVALASGASETRGPSSEGVSCDAGLYFSNVSGSMTGALWLKYLEP